MHADPNGLTTRKIKPQDKRECTLAYIVYSVMVTFMIMPS